MCVCRAVAANNRSRSSWKSQCACQPPNWANIMDGDSHWEIKLCESNLTLFDVKATRTYQEYRFSVCQFDFTLPFSWLWWVYSPHDSKYCMNSTVNFITSSLSLSLTFLFGCFVWKWFLRCIPYMQIAHTVDSVQNTSTTLRKTKFSGVSHCRELFIKFFLAHRLDIIKCKTQQTYRVFSFSLNKKLI